MVDLDNCMSCLSKMGISTSETLDLETLSMKLRQVFVEEITDHHNLYEDFVPHCDLTMITLAKQKSFFKNGFYNHELSDLMPLATATALQASLAVITTNPPMYVTPVVGCAERSIF